MYKFETLKRIKTEASNAFKLAVYRPSFFSLRTNLLDKTAQSATRQSVMSLSVTTEILVSHSTTDTQSRGAAFNITKSHPPPFCAQVS
jgi:hypothetical protein